MYVFKIPNCVKVEGIYLSISFGWEIDIVIIEKIKNKKTKIFFWKIFKEKIKKNNKSESSDYSNFSINQLKDKLKKVLLLENYEEAVIIRDEIEKRKK